MIVNSKKILNDFTAFSKRLNNKSKPHLINYSFSIDFFEPITLIDYLCKFYIDIFFFRNPNNNLSLIGLNSALELSDKNFSHFSYISERIKNWQHNIVSNSGDNYPIICCSAKFDPLKKSVLWNEFASLRIHIPEFTISFIDGKAKGYYNFVLDEKSNSEKLAGSFLEFLNKLEKATYEKDNYKNELNDLALKSDKVEFENWQKSFNESLKLMKEKKIDKLVLSRAHSFKLSSSVNWEKLLNKLAFRFPDCYLFLLKKDNSFFFGSSPEMFLKVKGNTAEVESVAGSAPRGERFESDSKFERLLKSSEKNHQEHLYVSRFISEILFRYSNDVKIIEEKQIRKLDNIQHLITRISAQLNSKEKLFELIDSLFPTPAVCGVPKNEAMKFIRSLESHDRGLYSGIIGLFNFNNDCELAVAIRSALVKENKVTAFAGAGLVMDSDCDEEYGETNLKLNTILSLFGNEDKRKQK